VAQSAGPEFKPQYSKKKKKSFIRSNLCVFLWNKV
jgi:hypothetical protein